MESCPVTVPCFSKNIKYSVFGKMVLSMDLEKSLIQKMVLLFGQVNLLIVFPKKIQTSLTLQVINISVNGRVTHLMEKVFCILSVVKCLLVLWYMVLEKTMDSCLLLKVILFMMVIGVIMSS